MSQPTALLPGERRILRLDEVEAKSGFKRAHIYSLMTKGEFPQSLRLGVRAVGWDSTEVDLWITERPKNRRSEERRVGKECVSTCRSREAPEHEKNTQTKK